MFTLIDLLAGKKTKGDDRVIGERRADALSDLFHQLLTYGHIDLRGLLDPTDSDDVDTDIDDIDDEDSNDVGSYDEYPYDDGDPSNPTTGDRNGPITSNCDWPDDASDTPTGQRTDNNAGPGHDDANNATMPTRLTMPTCPTMPTHPTMPTRPTMPTTRMPPMPMPMQTPTPPTHMPTSPIPGPVIPRPVTTQVALPPAPTVTTRPSAPATPETRTRTTRPMLTPHRRPVPSTRQSPPRPDPPPPQHRTPGNYYADKAADHTSP